MASAFRLNHQAIFQCGAFKKRPSHGGIGPSHWGHLGQLDPKSSQVVWRSAETWLEALHEDQASWDTPAVGVFKRTIESNNHGWQMWYKFWVVSGVHMYPYVYIWEYLAWFYPQGETMNKHVAAKDSHIHLYYSIFGATSKMVSALHVARSARS